MEKKIINEYDLTKDLLKKVRKLNESTKEQIQEQIGTEHIPINPNENPETSSLPPKETDGNWNPPENTETDDNWKSAESEGKDFTVINNVEVVVNSTDEADYEITDEEKGEISQLIDDFREDVSQIAEFGKLNIYSDNAKLDGKLGESNIGFMISAGDDNGTFLTNPGMVKLNDKTIENLNKLKTYQQKFNDTMNNIIANRQQN